MAAGRPAGPAARLTVAYEGTGFVGWARQPGLRSVEGELRRALETVRREPTPLTVAGRTDAGVHAVAQVVSHQGEPANPRAINALLPADMAVTASDSMPAGFDARNDATSRAYRYRLETSQIRPVEGRKSELWWPRTFDRQLLDAYAEQLVGRPDMTAFTPTNGRHVHFKRTVTHSEWHWTGSRGDFMIEADAFLHQMIRILVGTMLDFATAGKSPEEFAQLLSGRPRAEAGRTAPVHGLTLIGVGYGSSVLD